jgi:hypothetical protein
VARRRTRTLPGSGPVTFFVLFLIAVLVGGGVLASVF